MKCLKTHSESHNNQQMAANPDSKYEIVRVLFLSRAADLKDDRCVRLEAAPHRPIGGRHQSTARAIKKHTVCAAPLQVEHTSYLFYWIDLVSISGPFPFLYILYTIWLKRDFSSFLFATKPSRAQPILNFTSFFSQTSTCPDPFFSPLLHDSDLKSPLLCKAYGEVKSYSLNQINQMNVDQSYMWTSETGTAAFFGLVLSCNVYRAEGQRSDEA